MMSQNLIPDWVDGSHGKQVKRPVGKVEALKRCRKFLVSYINVPLDGLGNILQILQSISSVAFLSMMTLFSRATWIPCYASRSTAVD